MNIQKGAIIGDMRRTKATIGELEDDVKRLTKRLDDIRCEHDETVALVSIQCETLALQEEALQNWRDQIDVFFWVEAIKDPRPAVKNMPIGMKHCWRRRGRTEVERVCPRVQRGCRSEEAQLRPSTSGE